MIINNQVVLLYGSMSLFHTVIHNVFLLYYLDMFISVLKISKTSFLIGQVVFLVWNSINDPLFGWISDSNLLKANTNNQSKSTKYQIVIKRLQILRTSGPLLAISFALFWFQWMPISIQFVFCLCVYDSFLTSVDLQHTALLADLSLFITERAKLNKSSSIFSALASTSVFISYICWDKNYIFTFQTFCFLMAIFSTIGFIYSTHQLLNYYQQLTLKEKDDDEFLYHQQTERGKEVVAQQHQKLKNISENSSCLAFTSSLPRLSEYIVQLKNNHNFKCFVYINFVQVFHCHFNSNFFPLFLEILLSKELMTGIGPLLIGFSFMLPHLNNVYFLGLCERYGVYKVIRGLFIIKLLLALLMMIMGSHNIILVSFFIASNRIFTEGTCRLLNLVISDLVDEDCIKHQRDNQASALLFGMSSLLAKPGQTLAPLLGTWILSMVTGEDIFAIGGGSNALHGNQHQHEQQLRYRNGCFMMVTMTPLVCAIIQLFVWNHFTLHGRRLEGIKRARTRMNEDFGVV